MTALQQVSSPLVLVPAYGRRYSTIEAMLKDWEDGKYFRVIGHGCYASSRDIEALRNNSSSVTLCDPTNNLNVMV